QTLLSPIPDWLQDRRHCGRRWPAQVAQVRERIRAALQDMPEHPEIRALLQDSYLHYFHCLRIVEILKGTEASTKNLFGRYSSQRMKPPGMWGMPRAPRGDPSVPPAELSSLLCRSVSYEVPALRRQRGRWQQAQQELARREDECQLRAGELRERFLSSCRQYGIAGEDVHQELLAQAQALPSLLSRVGDGASALGDAIELYQACVAFVCDSPGAAALPLLRHVASHGNSSVFRWRTGREPQRLERPEPPRAPERPGGDTGGDAAGDTVGDTGGDTGDDTGDTGVDTGDPGGHGWGHGGGHAPEDVARGSDALTLLENPETRNQFIDELMELELFLAQRLQELEDEDDVVAMSQLQMAPAALQGQSHQRLQAQLGTARELLGQLCSRSTQHLCMILASPRYVGRVAALLRQRLLQAELLQAKRAALAQRRSRALAEQAALEPRLQRLQESARELQRLIEADISKRYGGRPVNLMGVNV
uniref:CDK5 regulatory subunit associated protein 3 n=1 Tax=Taeniopygia guttata TaxID=59729 RepID=H1A2T8_TAEGU